jgi:hypothetical protein
MKYDENSQSEQFLEKFKQMIEDQAKIAAIKPTYCGELCFKMRQGIKDIADTLESYYTANGTRAIIRDKRDGQEYVIDIRPKSLVDKK